MKRLFSFAARIIVIFTCFLLIVTMGACSSAPESTPQAIVQPTDTPGIMTPPTEKPAASELPPPTSAPTKAPPQPSDTPEPSPTPTRLPADPWGRMTYSLPKLSGAITASNLGVEQLARWGTGYPYSMGFSPDGELMGIETTAGKFIYNAHSAAPILYDEGLWNSIFPAGSMLLTHGQGITLLYKDGEVILSDERISPYALSPGQRWVAGFDSEQETLSVYDTQNGQAVDVLDLQNQEECLAEDWEGKMSPYVSYLGIMESGKSLVISCGGNSELALYSTDGEKILTFALEAAGLEKSPGGLKFSPDGSLLAGYSSDGSKIYLWNSSDGSFVTPLGGDNYPGNLKEIWISPDNSKLLAGFWGGQVILQEISKPDDAYLLHPEAPSAVDLDFSPDGSQLLVPFGDHFAIIDPDSGEILEDVFLEEKYSKYRSCVEFVFSADGTQLVCLASRLLAWQTEDLSAPLDAGQSGEGLQEVPALQAMALIRDNLQLLDNQTWKPTDTILLSDQTTGVYAFSPDTKLLALGEYGNVKILSRKEGKKFKGIEELAVESPNLLRFSPDGRRLAVIDESTLRMYDTTSWEEIGAWDHEFPIVAGTSFLDYIEPGSFELSFSPDSSLLATGSGEDIHLRNAENGKLQISLSGHSSFVSALAFSPDGKILASLSDDGSVLLWGIPK